MQLLEGEQEDINSSLVSVVLGKMGVIWYCLPSFLITTGTMVGFPTLESQLSTERLTATELPSDTTLLGQMEGMHIPLFRPRPLKYIRSLEGDLTIFQEIDPLALS